MKKQINPQSGVGILAFALMLIAAGTVAAVNPGGPAEKTQVEKNTSARDNFKE